MGSKTGWDEGLVEGEILPNHDIGTEVPIRLCHNALEVSDLNVGGKVAKLHRPVDRPAKPAGIMEFKEKPVAGICRRIERSDGVSQTAGGMDNGQAAVAQSDHLGQAAGLEGRGHEGEIGGRVAETGKRIMKSADRHAVMKAVDLHDVLEMREKRAIRDECELDAGFMVIGHDLVQDFRKELAAFLHGVEAGRPEEQGRGGVFLKTEDALEFTFVPQLAFLVAGGVVGFGQRRIGFWRPVFRQ